MYLLSSISKNQNKLKHEIQRFFHLLTLLYGFIYNHDENYGVFLRFKYDYKKFVQLREIIEDKLRKVDDEIKLRKFIHDILPIVLQENGEIHKPYREIYKEFIKNFIKDYDKKYLEPFLYRFANILRILDALIHDSDELIEREEKKEFDKNIAEGIITASMNWFEEIDKNYKRITKGRKIDYGEIWEREQSFANLFSEIIEKKDYGEIKRKIHDLNRFADKFIKLKIERKNNPDWGKIEEKLQEIIKNHSEEKLKFVHLIEKLNYDELTALLNLYSERVISSIGNDETEFVGFYTSGVFLSQFVTLMNNIQNSVWMFKVFPYVTLHPIVKNLEIGKIIVTDESIKTGFSYSLFKTYLTKSISPKLPTLYVHPFLFFTDYKRVITEEYIKPLISISLEKEEIDIPYKKLEIQYISVNFTQSKESIKKEIEENLFRGNQKRLDLSPYISGQKTILLFSKLFAERIKEKCNKKDVLIFSPSPKGRVLALWTAYLLKSDGINVYFDTNVLNENKEICKIAIDSSTDTGFTLAHRWYSKINKKFDADKIRDIINEFDLVLTIVKRDKDSGKLILNKLL